MIPHVERKIGEVQLEFLLCQGEVGHLLYFDYLQVSMLNTVLKKYNLCYT